ncbi:MAG: folylpolyglutamate synthase/dihydrofolate synthase family protein [Pseudomonadota bacterium]
MIVGDGARSDDPALDELLKRAQAAHPLAIDLSLDRLQGLLDRLDNPQRNLPPVFHIAGTNGKGSVGAFLRATLEAAGHQVHVYSSPHLVRFNERIRLAGTLIDDASLAALLTEVMAAGEDMPTTFFELTTAVGFLAFSRTAADALILEVGLGGRLDATNVVEAPLVTGISQISRDHERFLGTDILGIAREKAGIAKRGVPMVTARYPAAIAGQVAETAAIAGATLIPRGLDWDATFYRGALHYRDKAGKLNIAAPRMAGAHQHDNAALAVAMLRHQSALAVGEAAYRAGPGWATWPARLQVLADGPLVARAPAGATVWLDGGHNPAAARALADFLRRTNKDGAPVHIVAGMVEGKDVRGFLKALTPRATSLYAVPVPGHQTVPPETLVTLADSVGLAAQVAVDVAAAIAAIARAADPDRPPLILICGSLYLAGDVLKANGPLPT